MRSTLLVLGLVACGSSPPKTRVIAPAVLTLDEAGAEPRRVVRREIPLHTKEREQQQINTRVVQTLENTVLETGDARVQLPTITLIGDVEVTAVEPDGTMTVRYEAERATYLGDVPNPKVRRVVEAEVAALRKMKTTYRLSPQNVPSYDTKSPVGDLISQSAVRFPDQPIGVDAVWTVRSTVSVRGIVWERHATYHLKALDDAGASVEIDADATAQNQVLESDSHSSTRVTSGHETSHGLYLIPLHGLVATGGGKDTDDVSMQMVRGNLRVRTSTHTENEMMLEPADDVGTGQP
jgi:hypothetical protein